MDQDGGREKQEAEAWRRAYPELSEEEAVDSLTKALCVGDVSMLAHAEAMGHRWALSHWMLAMREESGSSVSWMLGRSAGPLSMEAAFEELALGSALWSLESMRAAGPAAMLAGPARPMGARLDRWLAACSRSKDADRYAQSLAQDEPWMLILGNAKAAGAWMGKWGSWTRMLGDIERGDDGDALAAAQAVAALVDALGQGAEPLAARRHLTIAQAACERATHSAGTMASIAPALDLLPSAMLAMPEMDPLRVSRSVSGIQLDAVGMSWSGRPNMGALALLGVSAADFEFVRARGWIGQGRAHGEPGDNGKAHACSPAAMLLASPFSKKRQEDGRFEALRKAGFAIEAALAQGELLAGSGRAALARYPALDAIAQREAIVEATTAPSSGATPPMRL